MPSTVDCHHSLKNGLSVKTKAVVQVDTDSLKTLYESGVPEAELAKLYKVQRLTIRRYARLYGWLRPSRVKSMRNELAARQKAALEASGQHLDVHELKASIWKERGEFLKEKAFDVVSGAFEGVTPSVVKNMIRGAKDLKAVVEVGGLLTGNTNQENAPSLAINIGFLRSGVKVEDAIDV